MNKEIKEYLGPYGCLLHVVLEIDQVIFRCNAQTGKVLPLLSKESEEAINGALKDILKPIQIDLMEKIFGIGQKKMSFGKIAKMKKTNENMIKGALAETLKELKQNSNVLIKILLENK